MHIIVVVFVVIVIAKSLQES